MEGTNDKLSFAELPQDDDFKNNVCYPYFRDIYIVRPYSAQIFVFRT
jgi:hypothetical protein